MNNFVNKKSLLGLFISVLGLYFAFLDFSFSEFYKVINQVNPIYLLIAIFFLWISIWLRAIRWKYLFNSEFQPSIFALYKVQFIGYFGNNVLPLRLGELIRAYIVGKKYNMTKSYVFGTIIVERLLDIFCLVLLLVAPYIESLIKIAMPGSIDKILGGKYSFILSIIFSASL